MKTILIALAAVIAVPATAQVTSSTTTTHESSRETKPAVVVVHHPARRHVPVRHKVKARTVTSSSVANPVEGTTTSTTVTRP